MHTTLSKWLSILDLYCWAEVLYALYSKPGRSVRSTDYPPFLFGASTDLTPPAVGDVVARARPDGREVVPVGARVGKAPRLGALAAPFLQVCRVVAAHHAASPSISTIQRNRVLFVTGKETNSVSTNRAIAPSGTSPTWSASLPSTLTKKTGMNIIWSLRNNHYKDYNCPPQIFLYFSGLQDSGMEKSGATSNKRPVQICFF